MRDFLINNKIIYLVIFITFILFSVELKAQRSRGVVACPVIKQLSQPDGSKINLYIKGDAVVNWYETVHGEKVLQSAKQWFVYAKIDSNGNMLESDKAVSAEKSLVSSLFSKSRKLENKDIFFSNEQIASKEARYFSKSQNLSSSSQKSSAINNTSFRFPNSGKRKMLTILAEFSDTPHLIEANEFHRMMNEENFNGTGSFRDFYLESSYSSLDISTKISVWVKLPHTKKYYGANDADGDDIRPREFIKDAVELAMKTNIDFSQFDNDGDGYVDFLQVIHSGVGEEGGEDRDAIWSHQWTLNGYIETPDGFKIHQYFTAPELYTNDNNLPSSIGVACHEFGHALGLVDYYDTDFGASGGYAEGLGNWELMDSGCWNNEGKSPAQTNVYSKYLLGWVNLKELDKSGDFELKDVETNKIGYILKSSNDAEFFVLENRQNKSFDKFIPYHGLLVYHVDRSNEGWLSNTVNTSPNKEGFKLLRSKSYAKNCPFPGESKVTYLTDISSPSNLKSNTQAYSYKSLVAISEDNEIIKFTYFHDNRIYHRLEFSVSSNNKGVNNAQINLIRKDNSSSPVASQYSNSSGIVLFDKVSTGSYELVITKEGYLNYEMDINVYEDKIIYADIERRHNLTVHVETKGKAIEDVVVKINAEEIGLSSLSPQITNANGDVIFEDIVFGYYSLSTDKYNFETSTKFVDIGKDTIINIDINAYNIRDALTHKIKLYPNPTDGEVNLEIELSDKAIIMLFDLRGTRVYMKNHEGGILHRLDFGYLATGVYNLLIIDNGYRISNRLIIN